MYNIKINTHIHDALLRTIKKQKMVRGAHVMGIHKILAILPRISIRGNWAHAGGNTR